MIQEDKACVCRESCVTGFQRHNSENFEAPKLALKMFQVRDGVRDAKIKQTVTHLAD